MFNRILTWKWTVINTVFWLSTIPSLFILHRLFYSTWHMSFGMSALIAYITAPVIGLFVVGVLLWKYPKLQYLKDEPYGMGYDWSINEVLGPYMIWGVLGSIVLIKGTL